MKDLDSLIRNGPAESLRLVRNDAVSKGTPLSDQELFFFHTVFNAVTDVLPLIAQYVVPDPIPLDPLPFFPVICKEYRKKK